MKAIVQSEFGDPAVLRVVEVGDPHLIPTEVLVRVRSIGLNPVEFYIRSGDFKMLGEPPFTLGWDVAGTVEAVSPGVSRFQVGDEVFGMPFFPRAANGYAELVATPARQLARKPANLTFQEAAALPLAGLTAWQSLVDGAGIEAGQRVLIHGAGGGVGHLAVQIAKHFGAYVVGTASEFKHEWLRGLGIDEVIDYRTKDFRQAVSDIDVALDCVGAVTARASIEVLKPGGTLATVVASYDTALANAVTDSGRRFVGIVVEPDRYALEQLAALAESGRLKVHVEQDFPFEDVAKAHEILQRVPKGKIVLSV
ncbi:NADP-dependent oxidoreductase [Nocardia sp. NPDC020380]|uniref:NADP-dependent oxidoreductase n=1 Tax=Nocardia sp. NPDC020380 TaxID=3364309 RepID=UPI0037978384